MSTRQATVGGTKLRQLGHVVSLPIALVLVAWVVSRHDWQGQDLWSNILQSMRLHYGTAYGKGAPPAYPPGTLLLFRPLYLFDFNSLRPFAFWLFLAALIWLVAYSLRLSRCRVSAAGFGLAVLVLGVSGPGFSELRVLNASALAAAFAVTAWYCVSQDRWQMAGCMMPVARL